MSALPLLALGVALLLTGAPNPALDRLRWLSEHRLHRSGARDPVPDPRAGRRRRWLSDLVAGERRRAAEQDELGRAIAAVIEECRAGAPPAEAFAAAGRGGPFAAAFVAAADSTTAGEPVRFPPGRAGHLASLGLACRVNLTTGMPLAGALAGVAEDLSADRRLRLAIDRSVSGPRSSAMLLALLPVLGLAMGEAMGAHPASLLVRGATGRLLLCAGLGFDLAGILWTRVLVRRIRP